MITEVQFGEISAETGAQVANGLVSTIIPVFNRPRMLREAVSSVLAQTYRPIEIIIVDDGSTDDTADICDELAAEHTGVLRAIHQPNHGPGVAREAGRRLARGSYIQYLDSDDLLHPAKFHEQVSALEEHPECGAAYCCCRHYLVGETPRNVAWKKSGKTFEAMYPLMLVERWWDTPCPLWRRSVCDAVGPWTDLRLEEDWEYDCRAAALGTRLVHCREFLADIRDHSQGRLSRGSGRSAERMRHRARAHRLMYGHALRAGISPDSPYMQFFARSLFLLARQCGAAGLAEESRDLFDLARQASGDARARGRDFAIYGRVARLFGWRAAGRLACWFDTARDCLTAQSEGTATDQLAGLAQSEFR